MCLHILLACLNADLLCHVGSPAQLVLRTYVVATKGLEDVNAASIRPHGGLGRRVLAVLLHEDVGAAVDVEVGDHSSRFSNAAPIALTISNSRFRTYGLEIL